MVNPGLGHHHRAFYGDGVRIEHAIHGPLFYLCNRKDCDWESERCEDCDSPYDDVYWLDQDLWDLIHERSPAGTLCPSCAVRRAMKQVGGGRW